MTELDLEDIYICTEKFAEVKDDDIEKKFDIKVYHKKVPDPTIRQEKITKSYSMMEAPSIAARAAFLTEKIWKNGSKLGIYFIEEPKKIKIIPIEKIEARRDDKGNPLKMDPLQKIISEKLQNGNYTVIDAIKEIVKERLEPIVNIKFHFVDNIEKSEIRITFNPRGGAWSLIGTDCVLKKRKPTMNLGWFDVATTIHEFCHALGMIHEHQNPHGNQIKWNTSLVYKWAEKTQGWDQTTTYTNIIKRYSTNSINGSEFDPNSIMLYFFPAKLTTDNKGTHQNLRLSPDDVIYLNKNYPDSPEKPEEFYKKIYKEDIHVGATGLPQIYTISPKHKKDKHDKHDKYYKEIDAVEKKLKEMQKEIDKELKKEHKRGYKEIDTVEKKLKEMQKEIDKDIKKEHKKEYKEIDTVEKKIKELEKKLEKEKTVDKIITEIPVSKDENKKKIDEKKIDEKKIDEKKIDENNNLEHKIETNLLKKNIINIKDAIRSQLNKIDTEEPNIIKTRNNYNIIISVCIVIIIILVIFIILYK